MSRLSSPRVRVATVVAAGGYGKTSHVAALVHGEARPVAWLDLDELDNDPDLLLPALVGALESVTDFDAEGLSIGGATPHQVATIVALRFSSALRRCTDPFVLVLDDIHSLVSQGALDLLGSLVDDVPDGSLLVLVGRAMHSPPLRRTRVRPDFVGLETQHLALTEPEIAVVLSDMDVPSDALDIGQLLADTEGWPVGVRLAGARWVAETRAGNTPIQGLKGRESDVADYVMGEWLGGMATEHREFLLRVSCLDWLSGPPCDAVMQRTDSADVLHRIFTDRVILIPLDRRAESYRMHPLLRDALRAELLRVDPEGARSSCSRASAWFEAVGDVDRAVQLAVAADDIDRAEALVVEHSGPFYANGRYASLQQWLDALPPARVRSSASLSLCASLARLGFGDSAATIAWMRLSEHLDRDAPDDASPGHLSLVTFRSLMNTDSFAQALRDASRAYRDLPPGIWHAAACLAVGTAALHLEGENAAPFLAQGAEESAIWGAPSLEASCRALLAMDAFWNGDAGRARSAARAARRVVAASDLEHAPSLALVMAVSSLVEATAGQLSKARDDWQRARQNLAYFDQVSAYTNVQARLALAHTCLLLDDRVGATALLQETQTFLDRQIQQTRAHGWADELTAMLSSTRRLAARGPTSLTSSELRVLHYLPTNLTLADIGGRLYLSRFTIKTHCSSIYRKLGVTSRSEAVDRARAMGLLPSTG